MENQQKIITLQGLGAYDALRPQIKPVSALWYQMLAMKREHKLIPGQLYRITDYVTTVNEMTITNARSAGHQFDVMVRADDDHTLNEQAWAVKHDGDTYFKDSRLEAWELRYQLDNVNWSARRGTYVIDEDDEYTFLHIGEVTLDGTAYHLLQGFGMYIEDWNEYAVCETFDEGADIIAYDGEPDNFSPDDTVGQITGTQIVENGGKGTITWMKDEYGNECPYDFKNIQFKRWKVTDALGRENINGHYVGILNNLSDDNQSIEDEEDFIWCYTFSMPVDGDQGTADVSLDGTNCYNNRFCTQYNGGKPALNDNVILTYNDYSMVYSNTFSGSDISSNTFSGDNIQRNTFSGSDISSNTFSGDLIRYNTFSGNSIYYNTFSGSDISNNTFSGNSIYYNTFSGNSIYYNTFSGDYIQNNTFSGNSIYYNTFSGDLIRYNTFSGSDISSNTFSGDLIQYNTFSGSDISNNTFSGNSLQYNTFSGKTLYCIFGFPATRCTFAAENTSQNVECMETCGKLENQTVTIPGNSDVAIYVGMNSSNQLKIWKPADLA